MGVVGRSGLRRRRGFGKGGSGVGRGRGEVWWFVVRVGLSEYGLSEVTRCVTMDCNSTRRLYRFGASFFLLATALVHFVMLSRMKS